MSNYLSSIFYFHRFLIFFSSCIILHVHDYKYHYKVFRVLILQNQTIVVKWKAKWLNKKICKLKKKDPILKKKEGCERR